MTDFMSKAHALRNAVNWNSNSSVEVIAAALREEYERAVEDAMAAAEYFRKGEVRASNVPRMDMGPEINLRISFAFDQSIRAAGCIWGLIRSLKGEGGHKAAAIFHADKDARS